MESKKEEKSKNSRELKIKKIWELESEKSKLVPKLITRHTPRILLLLSFYEWIVSTLTWILSNTSLSAIDKQFYFFIMLFLMLLPVVIAKFPYNPYGFMTKLLKTSPPYTLSSGVVLFFFAQLTDYFVFNHISLIILVLGVVIISDIISMAFRHQMYKLEIKENPTIIPPRIYSITMQIILIIFVLLATLHLFNNIELWRFIFMIIMTIIIYITIPGSFLLEWYFTDHLRRIAKEKIIGEEEKIIDPLGSLFNPPKDEVEGEIKKNK